MLVTTTHNVEGKRILEYKGLVAGEAILGANLFHAPKPAVGEMTDKAEQLGANAVIGVDIDYETVGTNGSMLMVTAAGTAVRIE